MSPGESIRIQPGADGAVLDVRVNPGAQRTRVLGVRDGALAVAVNAPPEKGKANQALLRFLARSLDLSRTALSLVSGETSRRKRIAFHGLAPPELRARLEILLEDDSG